jgi:hypothetical protein
MTTRHYNPDEVSVIVMDIPVKGFATGTFISLSFTDDNFVVTQSHNGEIIRSLKPNAVAELTLTLGKGVPSLQELSDRINLDQRTGLGAGSAMIKDLNGTSIIRAASSFAKKFPDTKNASEAESVEIVFFMTDIQDPVVGSNRLV